MNWQRVPSDDSESSMGEVPGSIPGIALFVVPIMLLTMPSYNTVIFVNENTFSGSCAREVAIHRLRMKDC